MYKTTIDTAAYFGLSRDWFDERKQNGTFRRGQHYKQRENGGVIIWSIEAIERWFDGEEMDDHYDELISKWVS
ncbi:MAG: hypothetical protein JXK05_13870 [Campylobacterales bacterium]|nr:hypothetical protein [Campylobacterales bacterium]